MNMSDPIADMLTRIRNAGRVFHPNLSLPSSKIKVEIARVLRQEGYIVDYRIKPSDNNKHDLEIDLKYKNKQHVIKGIKRESLPSRRVYVNVKEIPYILGGLGIVVMSTPAGVVSGKEAKIKKVGGEVLCSVW